MIEFEWDDWMELLKDSGLYIIRCRTRGAHFGYWFGIRVINFTPSGSVYDERLSEFFPKDYNLNP